MKLHLSLLLSTITLSTAFLLPSPSQQPQRTTPSNTALHQLRSLGFDTTGLYTREESERFKSQSKITHYIRKIRNKVAITPLGPKTLISGFDPESPSSIEVLDFLNAEQDAASTYFPFTSIVAHVPDGKSARKRMIGRNARYTGLLDKLEFIEGSSIVPSHEQLRDVNSWVVNVIAGGDYLDTLTQVVEAAEKADSVKNVAILLSGVGSDVTSSALKEMEDMIKSKATTFNYTVVIVPQWNDIPEAQCSYGVMNVTDVTDDTPLFAAGESFSRQESLRIVTECLAIEGAKGKCVIAKSYPDKSSVEGMLIQSMRESGFSRIEEVGMMVMNGSKGCMELIEAEQKPTGLPKDTRTPEEIKAQQEKADEIRKAKALEAKKAAIIQKRKDAVEEIAKEWAEREYFRKSLMSELVVPKDQFIEMIWERALFEGELEMKQREGKLVNVKMERKAWKASQEKKVKSEMKVAMERLKKRVKKEIDAY